MQEFVLVLALLTIQSSYKSDTERPAVAVADTAQFWFGDQTSWRIRTYAIDHDIHIYSLGARSDGTLFTPNEAEAHIRKHYGEVLAKYYIIRFKNPADPHEASVVLRAHGLNGKLEVAPAGFAFYNPDGAKYKSQSKPKMNGAPNPSLTAAAPDVSRP